MSHQELSSRIRATKNFLQRELVRNRTHADSSALSYRQIGDRMDMIHEAERIGVRNLDDRKNRKIVRMINELEGLRNVNLN